MKNRPSIKSPFTAAKLAAAEAQVKRGLQKFRAACAKESVKTTQAKINAAREVGYGLRKAAKLERYMKIHN